MSTIETHRDWDRRYAEEPMRPYPLEILRDPDDEESAKYMVVDALDMSPGRHLTAEVALNLEDWR